MMTKEETKKKVGELSRNINELRDKLCLAIDDERYEDAAVIRDEAAQKQSELMDLLSGRRNQCASEPRSQGECCSN